MEVNPYITAVVSAAGRGSRMGGDQNKMLLHLQGKTLLEHTLQALQGVGCIDHFVIVIRPEDEEEIAGEILPQVFKSKEAYTTTYGGETREDSTWQGLQAMPKQTTTVLYHDGARPFITKEVVDRTLEALANSNADGVICVVPVKDTIKVINAQKMVETTPNRANLVAVQTPQVFYKEALMNAYEKSRTEEVKTTDDAQIVELFGGKILTVLGDYENIKITTREDLLTGDLILASRKEKQ